MVERERFSFKLEVVYEWLPGYCSHYRMIGHNVTAYRWLHPMQVVEKIDRGKKLASVPKHPLRNMLKKKIPFEVPIFTNE